MKIYAAVTFLSMTYVASAAQTILKSAKLRKTVAAVPGVEVAAPTLPALTGMPVATSGSEAVTAQVSSHTNPAGTTVNHRITTQQSAGTDIYPRFHDETYYNSYFRQPYPGYITGVYPGFHGGTRHRYFRWAYPGLSAGVVYPGFYHAIRHGFLNSVYPGLPESAYPGLFGGAYSGYGSDMRPGFFGWAYRSLYGPRYFSYGASQRVGSYQAQVPAPLPEVVKPGAEPTTIGATTVTGGHLRIAERSIWRPNQRLVQRTSGVALHHNTFRPLPEELFGTTY